MTDHIHIAVTHPNGVKHYTLCPTRKKVVQTLALVILAILTITFASLYLLSERSTEAEAAIDRLRQERVVLNNEVAMLQQKRDELSQTIENKDVELTAITQRVVTVEDMLGLQSVAKDASLTHRLDVAAINSAVRYTMLQLIPNGKPIESYRRSSGYGSRTHLSRGKKIPHGLRFNFGHWHAGICPRGWRRRVCSPKSTQRVWQLRQNRPRLWLYDTLRSFG